MVWSNTLSHILKSEITSPNIQLTDILHFTLFGKNAFVEFYTFLEERKHECVTFIFKE